VIEAIRAWALGLGVWGLFLIALLDSSFLSFPQVTDALVLVLSARHPSHMLGYASASTVGSVAGCLLLFAVGRRGGDAFFRKRFKAAHVERALRLYQRWGVLAIAVPALLPPPTPFKLFTLLAGAAGMHWAAFAAAVALGRGIRYFVQAALAVKYGDDAAAFVARHGVDETVGLAIAILVAVLVWIVWRRRRTRADGAQ
jgi:membrane protein YqaA with SNARE-associated domain